MIKSKSKLVTPLQTDIALEPLKKLRCSSEPNRHITNFLLTQKHHQLRVAQLMRFTIHHIIDDKILVVLSNEADSYTQLCQLR